MRQWVKVDKTTAVPAGGSLQVTAISQLFPITKAKRKFLFCSGEIFDPDFVLVFNKPSVVTWIVETCPFIAFLFYDSAGVAIDFLYIQVDHHKFTAGANFGWVNDPANAGHKIAAPPSLSEEFFTYGRGGYPDGAVAVALVTGFSVTNTDGANPHNAVVSLRAIMEELPE